MGFMYDNGQGVPQNDKTALKWYALAAEQGYVDAQINFKLIQERIAREEQEKAERIAREKQKKAERIAREQESVSNPGFRDLKPGLHKSTIRKLNVCGNAWFSGWQRCYDIDNLKFKLISDHKDYLTKLTVNIGPIVEMSGGVVDRFKNYVERGETNIFLKMDSDLRKKYVRNFTYSERDRQFFNVGQKSDLLTVYEKGSVALRITRKVVKFAHQLWLFLEYRDKKSAKEFFDSVKPERAKASDY